MRFFLFGLGRLGFDDFFFFFCHLWLSEIESSWKLCGFDAVFLDFFRFFFLDTLHIHRGALLPDDPQCGVL